MWIKLIITVITLFLLFDEYFKVFDRVKKRNKRKIVLISLAVLSILSIVDVIIEVEEGNDLVEKANKIIVKSDTLISNTNFIITDLDRNIKSVEKSGKSIIAIDSVLKAVRDSVSSQVEIIKVAAGKSKELVRLGEKKFQQDEAKLSILTNEIELIDHLRDSTFFDVKFSFRNQGNRLAANIKFSNKLLVYNKNLDNFEDIFVNEHYFSESIGSNIKGDIRFKFPWKKEKLVKDYFLLILIIKCEYKDAVSDKIIPYKNHFLAKELKENKTDFSLILDYSTIQKINNALLNLNLNQYLIEPNK